MHNYIVNNRLDKNILKIEDCSDITDEAIFIFVNYKKKEFELEELTNKWIEFFPERNKKTPHRTMTRAMNGQSVNTLLNIGTYYDNNAIFVRSKPNTWKMIEANISEEFLSYRDNWEINKIKELAKEKYSIEVTDNVDELDWLEIKVKELIKNEN